MLPVTLEMISFLAIAVSSDYFSEDVADYMSANFSRDIKQTSHNLSTTLGQL